MSPPVFHLTDGFEVDDLSKLTWKQVAILLAHNVGQVAVAIAEKKDSHATEDGPA